MSLERLQSSGWLKVYTKFVKGKLAMGCFSFDCYIVLEFLKSRYQYLDRRVVNRQYNA